MKFGERLRELRREKDLKLRDVWKETGLSVPYLSELERGEDSQPSMKTLKKLADFYEKTVVDLLAGVDEFGEQPEKELPKGLKELKDDPIYGNQLTEEWVETLQRIDYRGKRPSTKNDWLEIFLHLRRLLEK